MVKITKAFSETCAITGREKCVYREAGQRIDEMVDGWMRAR